MDLENLIDACSEALHEYKQLFMEDYLKVGIFCAAGIREWVGMGGKDETIVNKISLSF